MRQVICDRCKRVICTGSSLPAFPDRSYRVGEDDEEIFKIVFERRVTSFTAELCGDCCLQLMQFIGIEAPAAREAGDLP